MAWIGSPGRYLGPAATEVEIDGKVFWVHVHLADVDGRLVCVGIDLRSFYEVDPELSARVDALHNPTGDRFTDSLITQLESSPETRPAKPLVRPTNDTFVEITSPIVRGLRTSEVIETAVAPMRDLLRRLAKSLQSEPGFEAVGSIVESRLEDGPPPGKRRGPQPLLDDAALRDVVAAAYRVATKRPVQAVRQALEESNALRPPVTIDQARKAVAAARARGFIPPAKRPQAHKGDQA